MDKVEIKVIPEGKDLNIRTGAAAEIFQYDGYQYNVFSTESLIALIKDKGHPNNSIVAYSDTGIKVIIDDEITDRIQDRIEYVFKMSQQFIEWEKILCGLSMAQKQFIDFMRRRDDGEIDDIEFLMSQVQQFKFVTSISGDFNYDDNNNYTFAIKVGDAESTVRLPQIIFANIEIYNESDFIQSMEIEIEVIKPKSENEKPIFSLSCPKLSRYKKIALEHEIEQIKKELVGFLIITGSI